MSFVRVLIGLTLLSLCVSLSAAPASVRAVDSASEVSHHEVILGVNPYFGFGGATSGGNMVTDLSGTFVFSVAADYNYAVLPWLQLGINTSFSHAATDTSAKVDFWEALAGPTFNLPLSDEWVYNSLFLSLKGGLLVASGSLSSLSASSTDAILNGEFGYRLKLMEHVTWSPALGSIKVLNGSKFIFLARPFAFSIVF